MNIGIVGSGIAGLVAAFKCRQNGHQVSLFERQASLGMAAHEFQFDHGGTSYRGDLPSRMFNPLQWPNLLSLYKEIGVEIEPVDASQSFGLLGGKTYLNLDVAYRPQNILATLLDARNHRIAGDAKRLVEQGPQDLTLGVDGRRTFKDYLHENNYSQEFIYSFLYPTLASTVCTCSYAALDRYPAAIILQTLQNLTAAGLSQPTPGLLFKTKHGTSDVVSRLIKNTDDIRLKTTVLSIRRDLNGCIVTHAPNDSPEQVTRSRFDQLLVATQANTALRIIPDLTAKERSMLSQFEYETTEVAVHRDTRLMPPKRNKWATFNQIIHQSSDGNHAAMCSVFMNQFHKNWNTDFPVFQTINPLLDIAPEKLISTATLQRPTVTVNSQRGWQGKNELHDEPDRTLWFCGSYACPGVPLLETAVESVLDLKWLNQSQPITPSI